MSDDWDEETTAVGIVVGGAAADTEQRKRPCVTVLTGTASGQLFKLPRGNTVLGRASNVEIRLADEGISRHHAKLWVETDKIMLEDLESRNGTFVNGSKISTPTALRDGDKIQIGATTVLKFAFQDGLDESFHENLLSSALRDPLTKLFNKRYFLDRLDSELKFARRHGAAVSLLLLDIDHFKQVNDTHGHLAGDAVLTNLASVLLRAVRNEDVVARFGGEELGIILRATPLDHALHLAERLRKTVEHTPTPHGGRELRVTVSIGAAEYPSAKVERIEELIEAADRALYRAKGGGRNRVQRLTLG